MKKKERNMMTKHISIAILSLRDLPSDFISVLEDDFFYHFGYMYYPSIRFFKPGSSEKEDELEENNYMARSVILSIYDEDSYELYTFIKNKGLIDNEVYMTKGESPRNISKKIILKVFGCISKSVHATWKSPRYLCIEESQFSLSELEPLTDDEQFFDCE